MATFIQQANSETYNLHPTNSLPSSTDVNLVAVFEKTQLAIIRSSNSTSKNCSGPVGKKGVGQVKGVDLLLRLADSIHQCLRIRPLLDAILPLPGIRVPSGFGLSIIVVSCLEIDIIA